MLDCAIVRECVQVSDRETGRAWRCSGDGTWTFRAQRNGSFSIIAGTLVDSSVQRCAFEYLQMWLRKNSDVRLAQ